MQLLHDLNNLANAFVVWTKPFVEWLFYVSGIILCFVGVRGLKQIRLLKADMLARSERSAKEKAIEASEKYLGEALDLYGVFIRELGKRNIPPYTKGVTGEFKGSEFPQTEKCSEETKKRFGLYFQWVSAFNKVEAIAAMFVSGVADDETGFAVIGLDLVEFVRSNYDLLTICQKALEGEKQHFSNIIKLYRAWAPRFTEKELQAQKSFLDEKLKNLEKPKMPNLTPDTN